VVVTICAVLMALPDPHHRRDCRHGAEPHSAPWPSLVPLIGGLLIWGVGSMAPGIGADPTSSR
jgi:hypothetical protein